jgi:ABC-type multidrug transport system ATPase subunit
VREVVDGRGASVIWATQRVEEIRGFADQVTVLDKGHVRFSGPVVGFLSHAEAGRFVVRLLLSSPEPTRAAVAECLEGVAEVVPAGDGAGQFLVAPAEGRFLGEALDRLGRAGFTVVSCTEERPGAEQAFLHLTSAR